MEQHECDGAVCIDTDGSYVCECLPGYQPVGASLTQCEGKVHFINKMSHGMGYPTMWYVQPYAQSDQSLC